MGCTWLCCVVLSLVGLGSVVLLCCVGLGCILLCCVGLGCILLCCVLLCCYVLCCAGAVLCCLVGI